ncbi:MAG: hypothetical protein JWP74_3669 [Marmoricola sp.]|nr:hypothetical protein [Marmoricola sp.]
MSLDTIVDSPPDVDASISTDGAPAWFPTADLASAAAALYARETVPEVAGRFADASLFSAAGLSPSARKAVDLGFVPVYTESIAVEGPRWRIEVGPGIVAVRSTDPTRRDRTLERQREDRAKRLDEMVDRMKAGEPEPEPAPTAGIRAWSRKSRSRMVERLAQLDYAPMFVLGGRLAMVTLTYPGEWLSVAPDSATCHKHLLALRRRFERRYDRPMVVVWKREFQRRGAPHYHLMMCPPAGDFRAWLSKAWASIVNHADPTQRARHALAGTGVDYAEGARYRDPKRAAVYFSKHGAFSAKEYQNEAPEEWGDGSVGRFWGLWHLDKAVAAVEVAPDVARTVLRTLRRYSDANGYQISVDRWRKVTTVDRETGEIGFRWRKRRTRVWVRRLRGTAGYLVVNDGPVLASSLARYAAQSTSVRVCRSRAGLGPVGYLP